MAAGSLADVAFVVVTRNSEADVRACVESIVAHALPAGRRATIAVVDNASGDRTGEILAELAQALPALRVTRCARNVGFGAANNIGFAAAPARRYVLLNPDAWLVADSVTPALALLDADPAIAVCGLPLVFPDGSPQTHAYLFSSWRKWLLQMLGVRAAVVRLARVGAIARALSRSRYGGEFAQTHARARLDLGRAGAAGHDGSCRPAEWVCGAALVVDGDFVRETGGFDEGMFLYGEDEDLCIQAHRRGRRVVVADVAPVVHVMGWGKTRHDGATANIRHRSLQHFIRKNVPGALDRLLMRLLLPFHVYGLRGLSRPWRRRRD